jgi:WXG100 family type VII secretion target
MSITIIQTNYDELTITRLRFDAQSEIVREVYRRLYSMMDVLKREGWQGRAATAFYEEMEAELLPAVQRLIYALEESSLTTDQLIRIYQQAEEEAAAPFTR